MNVNIDSWYSKFSSSMNLPSGECENVNEETSADDALYILELFELNFKQLSDGIYSFLLCFYNFRSRRFCGSQMTFSCASRNSVVTFGVGGLSPSPLSLNFRAAHAEISKNVVLVMEFGNREKTAICWMAVPVNSIAQISADSLPTLDTQQLRQSVPMFAGSCLPLMLADSLAQLQPHLRRMDAVGVVALRLSTSPPPSNLPQFHLKIGPLAENSSSTFLAILDNIELSHAAMSDSIILDVLSREYSYGRNRRVVRGVDDQLCVIERRLKIGVHDGVGFCEEPLCVVLQPTAGGASNETFRRRSHSLGRDNIGLSEYSARNSVRLRNFMCNPATVIVFSLEYLVGFRREGTDIYSATRLVRIGWAAWTPSANGQINMADTITLQIVGGPRPFPSDSLYLRDLSRSGLLRHSVPANKWLPASSKFEIRFSFLPVADGDHPRDLSNLSSQQLSTPQPRPDVRPHSVTATHQQEGSHRPISSPEQQIEAESLSSSSAEEDEKQTAAAVDVLSPVHHRRREQQSRRQQKGREREELFASVVHENLIEVDFPSTRVSAFPRRVSLHISNFQFPQIANDNGSLITVDPSAKRDIRPELERLDKFGISEVTFQFMAIKRLDSSPSTRLFFTFQFFRFDPIVTECLFADPQSCGDGGEEPFTLWRNGNSENGALGLIIRFVIGAEQRADFSHYLLNECVQLHVWEADSLFFVGTACFPLSVLLRQCSPAVTSSLQVPIVQSGFVPALGRNQLAGLLYLRIANIGRPVPFQTKNGTILNRRRGEKAKSLRANDGMRPLERFLAFQKMDLEQRSLRIFGKEENERVRQWAQLNSQSPVSGQLANGATKFLFSEELAAYRAIRREGKALALLKTVFSSVTTKIRKEAVGGQIVPFKFLLRNPLPEDCICSIEVNDPALRPIDGLKQIEKILGEEEGTWRIALKGMEKVEVHFCFDTGALESGWSDNTESRAFFRRLPSGDPLAILELSLSISRPFISQHFRWFADAGRKLVRSVPIAHPNRAVHRLMSLRASDPGVLCQFHNASDGEQRLRIECTSGAMADVRDFLVFLFLDANLTNLCSVYRVSIHAMARLHAETVQGQQLGVHFALPSSRIPPPEGELVSLFCSPVPSILRFSPAQTFATSLQSLAQMSLHFRPPNLGTVHLLINAVMASSSALLGQWMLSVAVDEPNIVKQFEITLPYNVEGPVRKNIPLDNPFSIARLLRLSSSDERHLSLPAPSPPPIPAHSSIAVPILLHPPSVRPSTIQSLLFVEDSQTGTQEESYAIKIHFN